MNVTWHELERFLRDIAPDADIKTIRSVMKNNLYWDSGARIDLSALAMICKIVLR